MKTIGLIGGMSWESSIEYYRIINEAAATRLGGLHSAQSLMDSVDFAEIESLQQQERWSEAAQALRSAAQRLERGGADCIVLCTNTMHKVADAIQTAVRIPLLHIADATAQAIGAAGLRHVGLLGTRFTMEEESYIRRLTERYGLTVHVPDGPARAKVHRIIYEELVRGRIEPASKKEYLAIIEQLVQAGAEAVILGCTEIGLLVRPSDCRVPLFDTTRIHALAAAEYALSD
ncbi:MAG: aspartate/glutamate racemase family protein [Deltaproteobacteria bacterium]|nr:aspartate/glutamate racemase family protein [Deltaproteobacteria bacterium]